MFGSTFPKGGKRWKMESFGSTFFKRWKFIESLSIYRFVLMSVSLEIQHENV